MISSISIHYSKVKVIWILEKNGIYIYIYTTYMNGFQQNGGKMGGKAHANLKVVIARQRERERWLEDEAWY